MQNNAINTGPIATLAEAIAGSDTTKLITPYTAYRTILARGLTATTQNLGMTTAGGLMTITAANQTALSTSNIGTVIIPSKTFGEFNTFYITSNQVLTISNMTNNLFGTTVGVAWSNSLRLYIYAVSNDAEDTVTFMVSRINSRVVAPAAANIGTPSSAIADTQGSFFAFSNITTSDYEGNPCVCVGSFLLTKSALDVWGQNPVSRDAGITKFGNGFLQTFPLGQFGAAASRIMLNNGGTAPNFTTSLVQYMLLPNGQCMMFVNLNTTTAGAGAVNTQMTIPFAPAYDTQPLVGGDIFLAGATTGYYPVLHSANYVEFKRISNGSFLLNSTSTANVAFVLTYQVSDQ